MDNQVTYLNDMNNQNDDRVTNDDITPNSMSATNQSAPSPSIPNANNLESSPLLTESYPKINTLQNLEIPAVPETISSLEKQLPEQPPLPQPPQESPQQNVQVLNSAPVENVVNKFHEEQKVSPIKTPGDKLTEEADKQEEHFIEEVDKHHGS